MDDSTRMALKHEASNLELEFAQSRCITAAVISHPEIILANEARAVVDIQLAGKGIHAIQITFDLMQLEPSPLSLSYYMDGKIQVFTIHEFSQSQFATWFVAKGVDPTDLVGMSDVERMCLLTHYSQPASDQMVTVH